MHDLDGSIRDYYTGQSEGGITKNICYVDVVIQFFEIFENLRIFFHSMIFINQFTNMRNKNRIKPL